MARTSQILAARSKQPNSSNQSDLPEPSSRPVAKVGELMDNTGDKPLRVPGFGLPIYHVLMNNERYRHGIDDMSAARMTVREVEMLALMDRVTDKKDWEVKVWDDSITDKWKQEVLSMPNTLMNEKSIDFCIEELRDSIPDYIKNSYVKVLDGGNIVVKSDILIDSELRESLILAAKPLQDLPEAHRDYQPKSNDMVLNLVHPSLHPLVYGRTLVLETGQVGLHSCLDSCGHGTIAAAGQLRSPEEYVPSAVGSAFLSDKFQWLPAEVSLHSGKAQFTSYINNLHPIKHRALYEIIERIVTISIPPFNAVLFRGHDHYHRRIDCQEAEYSPPRPEYGENLGAAGTAWLDKYGGLPDNDEERPSDEEDDQEVDVDASLKTFLDAERKWKYCRQLHHPEPKDFSDWKAGRFERDTHFADLIADFEQSGLQIIVKLAGIELSAEKPEYEGGSWHLEGKINEHIVATSIYYYDCENVTDSRLRFRQDAHLDELELRYDQDDHYGLEQIFGSPMRDEPAVQEIGDVSTQQGRLLVFPNTLQHRVEPFRLVDPTKAGHRRMLVLWLVDPHYRVISTRNIPPQQHDWWHDETMRKTAGLEKLPPELSRLVMSQTKDYPMSIEDAKSLRLELMAERTDLNDRVDGTRETYNLCEH